MNIIITSTVYGHLGDNQLGKSTGQHVSVNWGQLQKCVTYSVMCKQSSYEFI